MAIPGDAVLVIDMVNDFITGRLRCEPCAQVIGNIWKVTQVARAHRIPVIYVNDSHLPVDPEIKVWGHHSMKNSEGSSIIEELKPLASDFILEKRTYSAFFETGLDILLRSLGVNRVILTGIHTHICIKHTAADAFFRGYKIAVIKDATATFKKEDHESALEYMKTMYGAEILTTEELINSWNSNK